METALLGGRNEATVKHDNEDRKPKGPPVLKDRIPLFFCKINEYAITPKTRPSIKRRSLNHSIPKIALAIGKSDGRRISVLTNRLLKTSTLPFFENRISRNADALHRIFYSLLCNCQLWKNGIFLVAAKISYGDPQYRRFSRVGCSIP